MDLYEQAYLTRTTMKLTEVTDDSLHARHVPGPACYLVPGTYMLGTHVLRPACNVVPDLHVATQHVDGQKS